MDNRLNAQEAETEFFEKTRFLEGWFLEHRPLHSLAWALWIAAIVVILTLTRNPFYLALVIGAVAVVRWRCAPVALENNGQQAMLLSPLRFGLIVVTTAALFNMAMVHVGTTVLFVLPTWIPLLGGAWTLEALVYGALNGVALAGLFASFTVINRVVPVRSLLRLTPRAYYPVAVVVSIAVTFVPTTLQQIQQIREAQAVRGHRLRGVRSWLPLVVPLLEGGMERSLQLAEAMVARGFASGADAQARWPQMLVLAGFASIVAGWLMQLIWRQPIGGGVLLAAGGAALLLGLWRAGRSHPHTVYRPERWRGWDWVVVSGAVLAAGVFLLPIFARGTIFYYPYPTLNWPDFDWRIGLATLGLIAPAIG
ncbi:energy-coupling factor transporter transmembrane component T [Caldilinea sp.]|uniref:energy-coupling factor transporter transmembrane component T n=1 Tax=Caldilinea sp. TaxID=2293560 RepID=UPI002CD88593|nr:energy-coupling factor transporter transmembrane component T [Caldilinea sp.]HRA66707.1 energy-coupling factor transporter transmembrane component T [Caldilinea sp.]